MNLSKVKDVAIVFLVLGGSRSLYNDTQVSFLFFLSCTEERV